MSETKTPLRAEVPVERTWDLTPIFTGLDEWEQEFTEVAGEINKAEAYQGTLAKGSKQLLAALEYRDELFKRLSRLYVYAHLHEDVDTTNAVYQSLSARAVGLLTKGTAAFAFFNAEFMELPQETIARFLAENEALRLYTQEFKALNQQRPHILSHKEEELLAKAGEILESSENTFAMLDNADLTFPQVETGEGKKVELSHGLFGKYLESNDRTLRHNAYKGMYVPYTDYKNTFASTLSGAIKSDNFVAEVRGYDSARHAALAANSIPETVHDSLVTTINDNLHLLHRYVDIRKRALGLEDYAMYDMYVSPVEAVDMEFSIAEAKELMLDGLAAMGSEYQGILERAFSERWIDFIENKGKRSGAYSSGSYTTNPYILMNWQNTLMNAYTLAHELGHSVHSYYTRSTQPYVYGDYSIFLAEIASTTNENILTEYLLKKYDDPRIKAYILGNYLDGAKGTLFRQTQFAEFEHVIHTAAKEGTPLIAEYLTEQYSAINKKYYGTGVAYDEPIEMEWARIPHFYYNYYVYQYATGFSAATAFSQRISSEGAPALTKYTDFLKAGRSDFPIEVLKKAGLDMTTNQPILDALSVFERRLNELESILL